MGYWCCLVFVDHTIVGGVSSVYQAIHQGCQQPSTVFIIWSPQIVALACTLHPHELAAHLKRRCQLDDPMATTRLDVVTPSQVCFVLDVGVGDDQSPSPMHPPNR